MGDVKPLLFLTGGTRLPAAEPPRTAGELRFVPLDVPRLVRKPDGAIYLCDGWILDRHGRRLYGRCWADPLAVPPADLAPIDGQGPL